jgi:L-serine dehydratase
MRVNERHWRSDAEIDSGLDRVWAVMQACVQRGLAAEGVLPGVFQVRQRAAKLHRDLTAHPEAAPTNGAAGIVPAVLHYFTRFVPGATAAGARDFLLTAAAIGILYKENASISGAEVGCQGEVGVACSMAARALCAVLGGTPAQVENAAEIGMGHHVSLDQVIKTMRGTGADMLTRYKETARGGLAVNIVEC